MKKIMFFLFFLSYSSSGFCAGADVNAYQQGKADSKNLLSNIGSVDGIEKNISKPMTSDTKMQTFGSNSVAFDANISPKNTKKFVEIFMFPTGTGDLNKVIIKQDTDLDGTFDYSYETQKVSGICTNGYISCTPGTWNNCTGYRWSNSDSSIKIISNPASIKDDLDDCYCINKSCGSNLAFSNKKTVLTSLGHGITGAIQRSNPHLAVTNSSFSDLSISYTGLLSDLPLGTGGNMETYTSGSENPEKYYTGASADNGIPDSEINAMRNTDIYGDLSQAQASVDHPQSNQICTITREIKFNNDNKPYSILKNSCSEADLSECQPEAQEACNMENQCVFTIKNSALTGLQPLTSTQNMTAPNDIMWQIVMNGSQLKAINSSDGTVSILESGGEVWEKVETTYICDNSKLKEDIDGQKNLIKTVISPVHKSAKKENDFLMTYTDFSGQPQSSVLPYGEAPEQNCIPVCEVQIVLPMNDIVMDQRGHNLEDGTATYEDAGRWENSNNTTKTQNIIKTCVNDVCPIDTENKETLIKDCACTNEFSNAVSAMKVVEEMKDNMICSTD